MKKEVQINQCLIIREEIEKQNKINKEMKMDKELKCHEITITQMN